MAEELNFTRAALKVGIGQPPLSQQIRALEQEVGAPLFRRLSHGAELTEAGQAFLLEARALLAQAERALHTARRGAQGRVGRLRVGFTGSAAFCPVVPAALRAFGEQHPAVELCLEEANTTALLKHLLARQLDAAFIRPGRLDREDVRMQTLGQEAMVAAVPAKHRLASSKTLALFALVAGVAYLPIRQPALTARLALATRLDERSTVVRQFVAAVDSVREGGAEVFSPEMGSGRRRGSRAEKNFAPAC